MKDSRTNRKIPHTSLCKKVNMHIPSQWSELTQEELCKVLKAIATLSDLDMNDVKAAVLLRLNNMAAIRRTAEGWLCRKEEGYFILGEEYLPDLFDMLSYLERPEEMTDRIHSIGGHEAVDMWLKKLKFGLYLTLENYYQAYLTSRKQELLEMMTRVLYDIEDATHIEDWHMIGTFFWYVAVKKRFASEFPHFLKPVGEGQETGTPSSQKEIMTAQIRLLTKGDITKNEAILNADTWSALTELDALAKESEEFKQRMNKKK